MQKNELLKIIKKKEYFCLLKCQFKDLREVNSNEKLFNVTRINRIIIENKRKNTEIV